TSLRRAAVPRDAPLRVVEVLRRRQPFGPRENAVRVIPRLQDVPAADAVALDSAREVGLQAEGHARTTRVGDVPVAVRRRPLRRSAPVVEDGLANELD